MTESDKPTNVTRRAHHAACHDPVFDWENRQDFEFASRGLIHRPDDPAITDADGVVVWHHEAFEDFLHGEAPETVHPSLWRHALLDNYRGLFEVTGGVYQVRGESLANVTFVESDTGYVVIDPLTTVETAAYALNLLYEHIGKRPMRTRRRTGAARRTRARATPFGLPERHHLRGPADCQSRADSGRAARGVACMSRGKWRRAARTRPAPRPGRSGR